MLCARMECCGFAFSEFCIHKSLCSSHIYKIKDFIDASAVSEQSTYQHQRTWVWARDFCVHRNDTIHARPSISRWEMYMCVRRIINDAKWLAKIWHSAENSGMFQLFLGWIYSYRKFSHLPNVISSPFSQTAMNSWKEDFEDRGKSEDNNNKNSLKVQCLDRGAAAALVVCQW